MQLITVTSAITFTLILFLALTRRESNPDIKTDNRYNLLIFILIAVVLTVVSSLREGFIDTPIYRLIYEKSYNFSYIKSNNSVEIGYLFINYLLNFISLNSQLIIIFTSIAINTLFFRFIFRYSEDKPMSVFLYFTLFYMLTMNGIRQMLAVGLVLLVYPLIEKKKTLLFIFAITIISLFHMTVLVFIPLYFLIISKKLNKGIIGFLIFSVVFLFLKDPIFMLMRTIFQNTKYLVFFTNDYEGANIARVAIAVVPCILSLLYYKKCKISESEAEEKIVILSNIAFINLGFVIMAYGMLYFGRLALFFDVYNIILIPILIQRLYKGKQQLMLKFSAYILYSILFAYQIFIFGDYMEGFRLIF